MAITYPRFMPSTRVRSIVFEAEPAEAFAPEQGGRFVSVQLGPALWRMQLQTTPPSELEFSAWRAWLDTLEGGAKEFLGYDVRRPMPWNYRGGYAGLVRAGGGGAFNGSIAFKSINSDRDEITNIGSDEDSSAALPVGFQFEIGDYFTLFHAVAGLTRHSLHRIVDRPAAASSIGKTTVTVRPLVHPGVALLPFNTIGIGNAALAVRNHTEMRIVRRDRSAEHKSRSISFEAVQHFVV